MHVRTHPDRRVAPRPSSALQLPQGARLMGRLRSRFLGLHDEGRFSGGCGELLVGELEVLQLSLDYFAVRASLRGRPTYSVTDG